MNPNEPLPLDIQLMNGLASALYGVVVLMLLGAVLSWAMQLPIFAIRGVSVTGDVLHYNAITLRANVMPRLQGTFFTLDLAHARQVFESMPWVRHAVVQREFPNRLKVRLQEHQAVAFWGDEDEGRLVNTAGEVFEANVGELEQDKLPQLKGPQGQSTEVLAMYRLLQPVLAAHELELERLELTPRGGWRLGLDTGAQIELGAGSTDALLARLQRFLKSAPQVTARYHRTLDQLASVDLRHPNGYALRLYGVSTLDKGDPKTMAMQRNR